LELFHVVTQLGDRGSSAEFRVWQIADVKAGGFKSRFLCRGRTTANQEKENEESSAESDRSEGEMHGWGKPAERILEDKS
jgi:hypothetical protein